MSEIECNLCRKKNKSYIIFPEGEVVCRNCLSPRFKKLIEEISNELLTKRKKKRKLRVVI